MEEQFRKTSLILFFYLLFDLISFASILPVLPSLVHSFSLEKHDILYNTMTNVSEQFRDYINAPNNDKWNIVLFGGLLGASFSICQFICSPIIGALSDVFGRKIMLILTSSGMLISYLVWALCGNNFTIFFISRVIGGICKANIGIAIAIIGDIYGESNRNSGMAIVGIAFSLGFIIGPIVGVIAGSHCNVAIISTLLTIINLIFISYLFQETLPKSKRCLSIFNTISDVGQFINPVSIFLYKPMNNLKYRDLQRARQLGFVYFTYLFIYSGLEFTLTFLTHIRFNYTSVQQGRMYTFLGVVMILIQGGLVRRLKSGREKFMTMVGILSLIPGFCLLGFSQSVSYFYIGLFLFGFASSCVVSFLTSLISQCDNANAPQQGRLMGIFRSQGCLSRSLGPLFASVIFWIYGPRVTYALGALLMFVPLTGLTFISNKVSS